MQPGKRLKHFGVLFHQIRRDVEIARNFALKLTWDGLPAWLSRKTWCSGPDKHDGQIGRAPSTPLFAAPNYLASNVPYCP